MTTGESLVAKQVRLVLQKQCVELGKELAAKVPAGVGFTLVLADIGEKGNLAYVSSIGRDSAVEMLRNLADYIAAKGAER